MSTSNAPLAIQLKDLHAWYGESHILHGVNMDVRQGEVVSLLGRVRRANARVWRAHPGL